MVLCCEGIAGFNSDVLNDWGRFWIDSDMLIMIFWLFVCDELVCRFYDWEFCEFVRFWLC